MRLASFEMKKLFLRAPVLVALAVFTVLDLAKIRGTLLSESWIHSDPLWNRVYWQEYGKYSGELTMDKVNALLAVYRPLETATHDITATTREDVEGTLTGNMYSDRNLLERYYVKPMERFWTYASRAAEVVRAARENGEFYRKRGDLYEARRNEAIAALYEGRRVEEFAFTEGVRFYANYDFSLVLTLLLVLYGLSQTFTRDRECRMTELMLTSPGGGVSSVLTKIGAASAYVLAVSLWFSAADFAGFAVFSEIPCAGGMPVYAVGGFQEASVGLTVFGYFAVSALTRALGFWALGMVFLALGEGARHALLPFAAGAGVFLACTAAGVRWGYSHRTLLKALDPWCALVNRLLYGETEFVNVCGVPVLTWQASLICTAALGTLAAGLTVIFGGRNEWRRGRKR